MKKKADRRGHNEGTVYYETARKKYCAMLPASSGKRQLKRFDDETDAKNWLLQQRAALQAGTFIAPSELTFGEWLIHWLRTYKKSSVRVKTFESYQREASYLAPIYNYRLQDITSQMIQEVLNDLQNKGYSPSTLKKVKNLIVAAFKKAVSERIIAHSPALYLSAPTVRQKDVETFSSDEIRALLRAAKGHRWATSLHLMGLAGLRPSEVFGASFTDVNFQFNYIYITGSLVSTKTQGQIFEETKTPRSKRKIALPTAAMKSLERLKKAREKEGSKSTLITAGLEGRPASQSYYYKWFKNLCKKAGVPHRSPNTFRHTHATLLFQDNEPLLEVSRRLGHSTPVVTLNRYGHAIPGKDQPMADKAEKLFGMVAKVVAKEQKKNPKTAK